MSVEYLKRKMKFVIPEVLLEMAHEYPFYIAGGAVTSVYTNSEINDFDVYLKNKEDIFPFMYEICNVAYIISVTDKSVLLNHSGHLINIILMDGFPTVDKLFEAFDFTCVMGAYDVGNDVFITHEDFITDNSRRTLQFNHKTKFPIMSALRVKKYEERGYTISKNEFLRILLTAMTLDLKTYDDVAAQIGGMYGLDITKLVDTTKVFDLATIVDELSRVYLNYDVVANSVNDKYDDKRERLEELIIKTIADDDSKLGRCILDGKEYLLIDRKLFRMPKYLANRELPLFTEKIRVYKVIDKTESGEYRSQHRSEFEYKMGIVEGGPKGIYTSTFEDIKTGWLEKEGAILIEMEVNVEDIISTNKSFSFFGSTKELTFKKVNFIRETNRMGIIKSVDVDGNTFALDHYYQ
jgi:hypothetical protein